MTLRPCDLDLVNGLDLRDDLDPDFQWLVQVYILPLTCPRNSACYLAAGPMAICLCPCNDHKTLWPSHSKRPWPLGWPWPWFSMTGASIHTAFDLSSKKCLLLGSRAYGPYASAHVITLRPCDLHPVNNLDLCDYPDLDFQWLLQSYSPPLTCPQNPQTSI